MWIRTAWTPIWLAAVCSACSGDIRVDDSGPGLSGGGETSDSGSTDEDGDETETSGSTDEGESDDGMPKLDLGDVEPPENGIPKTCAEAEALEATVGCRFYATDLDNHPAHAVEAWGVVVGNVQDFDEGEDAQVRVSARVGDSWMVVEQGTVAPGELRVFEPDQFGHSPSALTPRSALRIDSDIPITAHQFNPIQAGADTSDASMLQPSVHWDHEFHVMTAEHIGEDNGGELYPYFSVIASVDDTVVEVVPSAATHFGPGVPAGEPGVPFQIVLDEGDVLQVAALLEGESLTGTTVTTDDDTPIAVFSAHRCGFVPVESGFCDHLEEQMLGLHQWGETFVASRVPVRSGQEVEPAVWQISAAEDDTMVSFEAAPGVTGLPPEPLTLHAGESVTLSVAGTSEQPGDFLIDASAPIQVFQYSVGGQVVSALDGQALSGDPSVVQHAPSDQFMERYVLLAPPKWIEDYVVIARLAGEEVFLDDQALSDSDFSPVGEGAYEVGRIPIADGAHTVHAKMPFSAIVTGWDTWDSYAYLGGSRTTFIYEPQG